MLADSNSQTFKYSNQILGNDPPAYVYIVDPVLMQEVRKIHVLLLNAYFWRVFSYDTFFNKNKIRESLRLQNTWVLNSRDTK